MAKRAKKQKPVLLVLEDRAQIAVVTAFAVLALQGFLGFFPENIENTQKIIIGIGGSALITFGWGTIKDWVKGVLKFFGM